MRFNSKTILLAIVFTVGLSATHLSAATKGALQAGAAKVDITPDAKALPRPFTSILDPIYVRAIYLDNGHDKALLMNADIGTIADTTWDAASKKIATQLSIPIPNIMISATHDHSAIFFGDATRDKEQAAAWIEKVEAAMVKAANDARSAAQPARIGYGTENVYLNVNRDVINEKTRLWEQEPNLNYPSDKTLAVIRIESLSGEPIAIYMNYAMHAVTLFLDGKVSGDFPGEAERYLERLYNDKAVALWTSGAAGDQNPIYLRANGTISKARIQALMDAEHVDLGTGIMRAMFVGDPAADNIAIDPVALEQSLELVKTEGQITAEAAIRAMASIRTFSTDVEIEGSQDMVTCAGRKRLDTGREGAPGKYEDSPDPIKLRIGALRVGDIAFGSANAELYNMIGQRVKQGSKLHDTIMLTLTNGFANSGYVPTDDAFGRYTFQVLSSRLKPGCAEAGIEHGVDDMIEKMD